MSSATLTGNQTEVAQFDTVTYEASWSGGQANNGDISIEYSRDGLTWKTLDFAATISATAASGTHTLVINEVGFKFTRPVYTRTNGSATGTINFVIFCTTKGA